MIKRGILLLGITALIFSSCIEHEVIPAPVPTVDLTCHFIGEINGAEIELTENVLSYTNVSTKDQIILAAPAFSSAVYYSEMTSPTVQTSIKVGIGSVSWDATVAPDPSLSTFNSFMLASDTPPFSDNGSDGFEATFTDATGREWDSNENSTNIQNVSFTGIVQESDSTGDYSLFICYFDCFAYSLNPDSLALPIPVIHVDSISIQNAEYQGWFKR